MKPFMNKKEIEFIRDLINEVGYKRIFEWGSGGSTVFFPLVCTIDSWTSIEHNKEWYDKIKDRVSNKVDLRLRNLDEYPEIDGEYDLFIIDGRRRKDCFLNAIKTNSPILLHDSGRKRYFDWYKNYPHRIIFEGEGKKGDFWDHRGLALFNE